MTAALLPFPLPARAPKPRRVVLAREPREPVRERVTMRRALEAVAGVAASIGEFRVLGFAEADEVRLLRDGRRVAWVDVEDGEYLVRWPARVLRRRHWTTTTRAELRDGLLLLAQGRSPDGRCLQLGCEWYDRHVGPHSEGAVTRLLGDRQIVMPWGV